MTTPPVNAYHFHQGPSYETCGKSVMKVRGTSARRCGEKREHPIHKFYTCSRVQCVGKKFWSLDHRLRHMEAVHGGE